MVSDPEGLTPTKPCAIGEKARIAAELRKRHVYLRLIPSRLENTTAALSLSKGGPDAPAVVRQAHHGVGE
jgi:hypothetical protein